MAENPILGFSDTVVYERGREPNVTTGQDIEQAGKNILDFYQGIETDRFIADLDKQESAFAEESAATNSRMEDAIGGATANVDPEFKQAVAQLTKLQLQADQGIGSSTGLRIRREHVLRQWTTKHPEWTEDLVRAANEHLGGMSVGEAIDKVKGPTAALSDVETHARQLGVDMSLRLTDPVAFSLDYVKATKAESRLREAQRTLQLVQTEQGTLRTISEGAMQQLFDSQVGEVVNTRINQFSDQILAMADTPSVAGEAEQLTAIRAAARKERADAIAFVTRQSGGLISVADAPNRVAQIAQLDAIINAADPSELSAVVAGIKGAREAELEGWYAANPGMAINAEVLKLIGSLQFPGLVSQKEIVSEMGRMAATIFKAQENAGNNKPTGIQVPRKDSLGITQDSTAAAKSTYNAVLAAVQQHRSVPEYSDRTMLDLADSWESGQRPNQRAVGLARKFMASDDYKNVVGVSQLTPELRMERAIRITNMLVGYLGETTPKANGKALLWVPAFGGIEWKKGRAQLVGGSTPTDLEAANRDVAGQLTETVLAIANAAGLSPEEAASKLWQILNDFSGVE